MFDTFLATMSSFYKYCLEVKWRVFGAILLGVVTVGLAVVWSEREQIVHALTAPQAAASAPASAAK